MAENKECKRKILQRLRGFTSLMLVGMGLVVALSGIILYLAPTGREARLTGWSALGLDKWRWGALHVDFIWFFLGAMILHIVINWRPLYSYLKQRAGSGLRLTPALIGSLLAVGLILAASMLDVPPFGRHGRWALPGGQGRCDHPHHRMLRSQNANLCIDELAGRLALDRGAARAALAQAGYPPSTGKETVGDLAKRFGVRPRSIIDVLWRQAGGTSDDCWGQGRGQGWGQGRGQGWGQGRGQGWGQGRGQGWGQGRGQGWGQGRGRGWSQGGRGITQGSAAR